MPKAWFTCPDGEQIRIEDCMKSCRMAERCAPKPILKMAAEERRWNGKPSVTQLDRCRRQLWLQERVEYPESPKNAVYRILGTGTHANIEHRAEEGEAEQRLEINGITGVTDLVDEDEGEHVLTDYKTVGSFAVAKMLGITEIDRRDIYTESGEPVLYQRGPKKGKVKQESIYGPDPEKADISDYIMQPNIYRLAWQEMNPGKEISRLRIYAIVRDGGLYTAKQRGVTKRAYMVPIPILPEWEVKAWMDAKRAEIVEAMESESVPPVGTPEQTWGGKFCREYCPVREACRAYGDNGYLQED